MTHVLVAYASRRGATAEIAGWIGDALRDAGLDVDVREAAGVQRLDGYDAVVLGSAVYMGRWRRDARRFARRHRRALFDRAVWLFSSGPLDHSADDGTLPSPAGVRRIAERIGARGDTVFGGALSPGTPGRLARGIAAQQGGDYRSRAAIRQWSETVAADLAAERLA